MEKRNIVRMMKRLNGDLTSLEGTHFEIRGFENYQSVEFNRKMRQHRQEIIEKVLLTQDRHRRCLFQDSSICIDCKEDDSINFVSSLENDIAHESILISEWSRNCAYQRALKDQDEVRLQIKS
jgi:hypothetical protein